MRISQILFFSILYQLILILCEQRFISEDKEYQIDDGSEISFSQNEQQRTFVYEIREQSYIQIKVSVKQQSLQNSQYRTQLCSSKNKIPNLLDKTSSYLLKVNGDQCDTLNYSLNSSNHYLYYLPGSINVGDKIYISVFISKSLDNIIYTIQVSLSDTPLCPKQCSSQGACQQSCKCQCYKGYIKDDCSISAPQLELNQEWKSQISYGVIKYVTIDFKDPSFEDLSPIISIVFKRKQSSIRVLGDSVSQSSGQLTIYYLFKRYDSEEIPSEIQSKSIEYMTEDTLSIDFVKEQIEDLTNKTMLVISISSKEASQQEISVEVITHEVVADDSVKNKIFIFFFGGLGFIFLLWIVILLYRTYKKRRIEQQRQQQALEAIINRRTNRVSPSKLSLNNDLINKYMPLQKYSDIQAILQQSNKDIASHSLIMLLIQREQKETQINQSVQFGKQQSVSTFYPSPFLPHNQDNQDINGKSKSLENQQNLNQTGINQDNSIINLGNFQDQNNGQLEQQQLQQNISNFLDQNENNLLRNNSNNFDNSRNIDSLCEYDEYDDDDNFDDGAMSKEVEQDKPQDDNPNNLESAQTCSVCLLEFNGQDEIRITICDHIFHSECLLQWFKSQETCPNCRKDLQRRKLRQWFSKVKKQRKQMVLQREHTASSTTLFAIFPQNQVKGNNSTKHNNGKVFSFNDQPSPSRKRIPIFTFNRAKSIKRMNSKQENQRQKQEDQEGQNQFKNIDFSRIQIDSNQVDQQIQILDEQNKNSNLQTGTQEISFNGAVVRIPSTHPKNFSHKTSLDNRILEIKLQNQILSAEVVEDENEDEEEKKNQNSEIQLKEQNSDKIVEDLNQIEVENKKEVETYQSLQQNGIDAVSVIKTQLNEMEKNSFYFQDNSGIKLDLQDKQNSIEKTEECQQDQLRDSTQVHKIDYNELQQNLLNFELVENEKSREHENDTKQFEQIQILTQNVNRLPIEKPKIKRSSIVGRQDDSLKQKASVNEDIEIVELANNSKSEYINNNNNHQSKILQITKLDQKDGLLNKNNTALIESLEGKKQDFIESIDKQNQQQITLKDQLVESKFYNQKVSVLANIEDIDLNYLADGLVDQSRFNRTPTSNSQFNNNEVQNSIQIDLNNRNQTPNKLESATQNIEINSQFDPSIFCLKTEEINKIKINSKQNPQNKEKSHTAMRNNKKIVEQDKKNNIQNFSNVQIKQDIKLKPKNARLSSLSPDFSNTPQQINSNTVKMNINQRSQLNSSPLLIKNASNILNSKLFAVDKSPVQTKNTIDNQSVMTLSKLSINQDYQIQKQSNQQILTNFNSNEQDLTPTQKRKKFQEYKITNTENSRNRNSSNNNQGQRKSQKFN